MKKTAMILALMFLFCAFNRQGFTSGLCGRVLTSYKGVDVFSNDGHGGEGCAGRGAYGLQYQCVEYVRRFYHQIKGIETREGMMGFRWNGDASTYVVTAREKGLTFYANGGIVAPEPDDILAFSGGLYGHVAIIAFVGPNTVHLVEQNSSTVGEASVSYNPQTHRLEDYWVGSTRFHPEGWLRVATDHPPVTGTQAVLRESAPSR